MPKLLIKILEHHSTEIMQWPITKPWRRHLRPKISTNAKNSQKITKVLLQNFCYKALFCLYQNIALPKQIDLTKVIINHLSQKPVSTSNIPGKLPEIRRR